MSKTYYVVNAKSAQTMYESFMDIYPDLAPLCNGFREYNWDDELRRILINLKDMSVRILFSVMRTDTLGPWIQYSALLIPKEPKEEEWT